MGTRRSRMASHTTQRSNSVDGPVEVRRHGRPLVSVVIPTLNEEQGIGPTLQGIPREALGQAGYDLEIVVVDGNSRDRTREIAEGMGARVVNEPRKGYGRAYKTGFEKARGDIIVTADADTTYPIEDILGLIQLLEEEKLDFITGNRFGRMLDGAMSAKHRIGNRILSLAGRMLFRVDVHDSQSGMWVFRRRVLERVRLVSDGMPLSEEIKIEAFRQKDLRCREVPIEYRARVGEVKLASWRDGWRNLSFLLLKRIGLPPRAP